MSGWFHQNLGNLLVVLALCLILGLVIRRLVRQRGSGGCHGCTGCASAARCDALRREFRALKEHEAPSEDPPTD